jgi:hypothetical protein
MTNGEWKMLRPNLCRLNLGKEHLRPSNNSPLLVQAPASYEHLLIAYFAYIDFHNSRKSD